MSFLSFIFIVLRVIAGIQFYYLYVYFINFMQQSPS
jgi:hypothetical protein